MNRLIVVLLSLVVGFLMVQGSAFPIMLAAGFIALPLIIVRPKWFFLFFLFFRALMDLMAREGGGSIFVSLLTIILVVICEFQIIAQHRKLSADRKKILGNFNTAFFSLLSVAAASFVNTSSAVISLSDFLRLLSVGVVFNYSFVYFSEDTEFKKIIMAVLSSAGINMLIGCYQVAFHQGRITEGFHRVFASFVHPNVFSEYLFIIFFLILYLMASQKHSTRNYYFLVLFLLITLFLIFHTYTRNVWIALCVAGLFYVMSAERLAIKIRSLFVITSSLILVSPFIIGRWLDLTRPKLHKINTWEWRLQLWQSTVGHIKEKFWIGHGLGMYQFKIGVMAHNDYLRIFYEIGFLGLICYLLVWGAIARHSFRKIADSKSGHEQLRYRVILSIVIGFAVISMADNLARSTVILIYAFAIISALLARPSDLRSKTLKN